MSKPGYRHLLLGAASALWFALSAPASPAAPSGDRPTAPQAASAAPATSAAVPAAPAVAAPMTGPQIIQLLDQTIDWYRTLGIQQQAANEPSDLLILYDNRQTANHVLGLAFEHREGRCRDSRQGTGTEGCRGAAASSQSLSRLQSKFSAQSAAIQAETGFRPQVSWPRPGSQQRSELQAKISELQGELDLINARKSLLATMSTFATQSDTGKA